MATPESARLLALAESIADGAPIDWDLAEATAEEHDLPVIRRLRILANLAALHRSLPTAPAQGPVARWSNTTLPIGNWGHLALIERLGGGSSGDVYRAWDSQLESEVALKLLRTDDATDDARSSRIAREGRLLARVDHPNVITVHGVAEDDGRFGLWMQLIRGATLEQLVVKQGPMSAREAALIGIDLCRALAAIHAAGLIHRDVKAQNVMREDGGRIVLMDLGTGRENDPNRSAALDDFAGTPLYLAPELFQGAAASEQTDLYSLGVLLYYLVTGCFPVRATTLDQLREGHATRAGVRLRDARADLPTSFVSVVDRAIAADPARRHATAGALEADLVQAMNAIAAMPADQPRAEHFSWRPHRMLAAGLTVVLLLAGLGWRTLATRRPATGAVLIGSLAVLPLANLSGDPAQEYFADGMTEELIHDLAKIHSLRVISRTSVMQFKRTSKSLREIAAALNVDAILEGSVARSGDRVRISVNLVHAATDRHLWVERYERSMQDVLVLQSEVAQRIALEVRGQLTPQEKARFAAVKPVEPAAQEAYLQGRFQWNKRTDGALQQALAHFQKAAALDPGFARAYAGQADVYNMLPSAAVVALDGQTSPFVTYPLAKAAATKALAIDPDLAEAHTSLAYAAYVFDRDWEAAEAAFRRGIQLNPGYATAHQWYADYLIAVGRVSEALTEIDTAMTLDPLSPAIRVFRGAILYSARRYDDAIAQLQGALEIEPANAVAYYYRAAAYEQKGMFTDAEADIRRALQLAPRDPLMVAESARVAARMGDAAGARRIASNLTARSRQEGIPSDTIAYIYAALGDKDRAFELLAQAERELWPGVLWAKTLPELDPLRDDPRFDVLLRSLRLAR